MTRVLSKQIGPKKLLNEHLPEIEPLLATPKRDSEAVHRLYSYPAKFQAQVPDLLIEKFSKPGDVILDPFGGGGTTLASSVVQSRSAIHYDMSPLSCLVAQAKSTHVTKKDAERLIEILENFKYSKKVKSLLSDEEQLLFGTNVSHTAQYIFSKIEKDLTSKDRLAPILAVLLIKFLRLCGRRDATKRRDQKLNYHLGWFKSEIKKLQNYWTSKASNSISKKKIVCGSNHSIRLKDQSVDLIVTSPPYAGVDVEYFQIQIQRRDLRRCFRSDVAIRISNLFYSGTAEKKQLCTGGISDNYFENAYASLKEMRRVLKKGKFAFLYTGFKSDDDRKRYEDTLKSAGFQLHKRCDVTLSDDRLASSRSTHHGKETNMMKRDYFYVVG